MSRWSRIIPTGSPMIAPGPMRSRRRVISPGGLRWK